MIKLNFEAFKRQWLEDIEKLSSQKDKSQAFCRKLFTQWRDIPEESDDLSEIIYSVDLGIDYIYAETTESEETLENTSTTWYLIQSKFAIRSSESSSILTDGEKALRSIERIMNGDGALVESSILFKQFIELNRVSDRIVLVLSSLNTLTQTERNQLQNIRTIARDVFNGIFDVEAISLETIFANSVDESLTYLANIKVSLSGTLTPSGNNVLVGSVSLPCLYSFLKEYREQTGDLDQLYEKNVRRFLGTRRRVNRQMRETLSTDPSQFGLFNNGITLVVKDFEDIKDGYILNEPYIVNGCQTTRTIWDIFSQKYESNRSTDTEWKSQTESGIVIVKVVRVGSSGEDLLAKITRYTNSQNSVSEKDFITLDKGFQAFKDQMATKHNIFLEIQRGGWDSQLAYQSQNSDTFLFSMHANAFDLLKVYGAGWLREPGYAFGRNMAFVPGGRIYKKIIEGEDNQFTVDDLYAAYCLEKAADTLDFGRNAKRATRRLTRYLFYFVTIDLLRDVMVRNNIPVNNKTITQSINRLAVSSDPFNALIESAVSVVDEYMTQGEDESIFNESEFAGRFNKNINGYLKWTDLGRPNNSDKLHALLAIHKRTMGRGAPSPREIIADKIK